MPSRERKQQYFEKMEDLLTNYKKIVFVGADHVGSLQFQKIRIALRGEAVVLMGKNTMMRKVVNGYIQKTNVAGEVHPMEKLLPLIVGNVGMIFTNGDFASIAETIEENRVPAAAKAGVVAECDVIVPPGPTGCDPGQTSWFQALNVPTKISRGQIEIVSELKLITKGSKVGTSEAALLQKLAICPFTYGLTLDYVYDDGSLFDAAVLDITDDDLKAKFTQAMRMAAALSLGAGFPTLAALPHILGLAIRRCIAVTAVTGYSFPAAAPWAELFPKEAAPAEEVAAEE